MEEEKKTILMDHESDQYTRRIPCSYCRKTNVFTKAFMNKKLDLKNASVYLCYNCGVDFVDKNIGWELIQTKVYF